MSLSPWIEELRLPFHIYIINYDITLFLNDISNLKKKMIKMKISVSYARSIEKQKEKSDGINDKLEIIG